MGLLVLRATFTTLFSVVSFTAAAVTLEVEWRAGKESDLRGWSVFGLEPGRPLQSKATGWQSAISSVNSEGPWARGVETGNDPIHPRAGPDWGAVSDLADPRTMSDSDGVASFPHFAFLLASAGQSEKSAKTALFTIAGGHVVEHEGEIGILGSGPIHPYSAPPQSVEPIPLVATWILMLAGAGLVAVAVPRTRRVSALLRGVA